MKAAVLEAAVAVLDEAEAMVVAHPRAARHEGDLARGAVRHPQAQRIGEEGLALLPVVREHQQVAELARAHRFAQVLPEVAIDTGFRRRGHGRRGFERSTRRKVDPGAPGVLEPQAFSHAAERRGERAHAHAVQAFLEAGQVLGPDREGQVVKALARAALQGHHFGRAGGREAGVRLHLQRTPHAVRVQAEGGEELFGHAQVGDLQTITGQVLNSQYVVHQCSFRSSRWREPPGA
ncbi:hypothetical protein D3C71_1424600 [compost metagenome]